MRFEVNINKKHAFMIFGAILVLAGAILVVAQVPNPGHDSDDIDFSSGIEVTQNEKINIGDAYFSGGDGGGATKAHFGYNAWNDGSIWNHPNDGGVTLLQLKEEDIKFFSKESASDPWVTELKINDDGLFVRDYNIKLLMHDCAGGCDNIGATTEGSPDNLCSDAFGLKWKALTVDCEDYNMVSDTEASMSDDINYCVEVIGVDVAVNCYQTP